MLFNIILNRNGKKNVNFLTSIRFVVNKSHSAANIQNESIKKTINTEWDDALPYLKIPGPSTLNLFTSFLPGGKFYKTTRVNSMRSLFNEYGEIVRLKGAFGKRDMIIIRDPASFEKLYRTEGIWPQRRALETLVHYRTVKNPKPFWQNEEWAKFRSIVNPVMMQPRIIKVYTPKMNQVADEFIEKICEIRDPQTNEMPATFEHVINLWTLESICVVALDKQLGLLRDNAENPDAKKLINALSIFFAVTGDLDINPSIWRFIKTPKYHKLMKAFDDLTEVSGKYINEALRRYENENSSQKNEDDKSVLEKLLKYDQKVAVVMATDMFLAGVDTTTTALAGALLAFAKNPEKQEKVREEIKYILRSKKTPLTVENMKNLPYMRACIKESMRMYPVAQGGMRASGQDIVMHGYQIPKGTDVVMIPEFENTEFDFDKPNEFIPQRWLRVQNEKQNECPIAVKMAHPFASLPFGFGPRACIGKRIVEMELEIVIAKIIRNFHVEYNYPDDDFFTLKLIYVPNKELKFKFTDIVD